VVATLLGFFFLDEAPTVMNVLGSIVIVIGLILATRPNRNGKPKPIEEPQ